MRQFRSFALRTTCCAALAALISATPAFAQIDEIIVTAERRSENIQDVPIAVTAVTAATLQDLQIDQTEDLARLVPGLKLLPVTSNPSNFQVALRGSTQQDASLVVAESPVGFYVDDIYIARLNGANAQLADLERIEVLRGPQGTLYGRNTLAGAIKLVTRDPGPETDLRLSVGYGDYGRYRVSGAVGGPVGDTALFASLAGLADGFDGYYTNLADGSDWGQETNYAVRGKLVVDAGGPFTSELSLSYADSKNDGYVPSFVPFPGVPQVSSDDLVFGLGDPYAVNLAPNPALPAPILPQPRGETDQLIGSLNLAWDFGSVTARSITGYVATNDFFSVEFTGIGAFPGANRSETKQFSQEVQLQGTGLDDRLEWLAGLYYFTETADQTVALVTSDALSIDTDSISAFTNLDFAVTDRLGLTVGARWTHDDKAFSGVIRQFGTLAPIFPQVDLDRSFDAFTPKFGLNYRMSDDVFAYTSVGRGFKSGGFNGIAFGNIDVLRTAYDPETNWTYEAGIKADLLDQTLRINAAAFFNDISDIALNAQIVGPAGVAFPVQNAGDAEVLGLELETVFAPIDGLDLFANLTWQDGEFTDLNPGSTAAFAAAQFGSVEIQQLSDVALTLGGTYEFASPFQTDGRIQVGADYSYVSDYFSTTGNDIKIEGYDRANGFVGYRFGNGLEARVEATNLFDSVDIVTGAPVFSAVAVAPPRQVMFTLSYTR